jgi:phosphoribosyl-AMP cyclohydrolase
MTDLPITFDANGLVPAVIQDAATSDVLMVGFLNPEALAATRETGKVHFWSRSRGKLWMKGETSGNVLAVESIKTNCELNSLLIAVTPTGATCHDGYPTCYYRRLEDDNSLTTVRDRWFDPADVYGGQPEGIGDLTRRWWTAYEQLKSTDFAQYSGTSRALRAEEDTVTSRVADELRELAGVLDGSHTHRSPADDLALEGGQVCYWLALACIRRDLTWDMVRPDRALDDAPAAPVGTIVLLLKDAAATWETIPADVGAEAHRAFALVAAAAAIHDVAPRAIIEDDLANVSARISSYQAR